METELGNKPWDHAKESCIRKEVGSNKVRKTGGSEGGPLLMNLDGEGIVRMAVLFASSTTTTTTSIITINTRTTLT